MRRKTYHGKYTVENRGKYRGDVSNVVFRSSWELALLRWCDFNPNVQWFSSEETVIPYTSKVDGKQHRYFLDMTIAFNGGKVLMVEVKPRSQLVPPQKRRGKEQQYILEAIEYAKNVSKWSAAEEYAKKRGATFQIWTEETLVKIGALLPSRVRL